MVNDPIDYEALAQKEKELDEGRKAGQALENFVNRYCGGNIEKGLFDHVVNKTHRTLQQRIVRLCTKLLMAISESYADGRNQMAVDFCKDFKRFYEDGKYFFPLI